MAIREFADAVRTALGERLVEMRLFGSKARSDDTDASDIDVLLVIRDADWRLENRIVDLAFDVNLRHDVFVAPLLIDQARFEDPVWRITDLALAVAEEGIPL
ncbi:MAG: nucleotidyltransferase domain-containing protein [Longimicrobiaceae bacterium]